MDSQERLELKALVQEAMAPVEKRLDGIEIRLDSIETRLADLPTRAEVQTIVDDAYDKQAASALREFGAIQRQLASLESRVGKLENLTSRRLDNADAALIDQKMVSYDLRTAHTILRERIAELEARVATLEATRNG